MLKHLAILLTACAGFVDARSEAERAKAVLLKGKAEVELAHADQIDSHTSREESRATWARIERGMLVGLAFGKALVQIKDERAFQRSITDITRNFGKWWLDAQERSHDIGCCCPKCVEPGQYCGPDEGCAPNVKQMDPINVPEHLSPLCGPLTLDPGELAGVIGESGGGAPMLVHYP